MDEFIYNMLLTGEQGLTLFGTLRYRFVEPVSALADGGVPAILAEAQQIGTVSVVVFSATGTLSVPLLTGFSRVPVSGIVLATAAGPIATLFGSSDPLRPLFTQFNQISSNRVAGGLLWRPSDPAELAFSMLGTQLILPF